VTTAEDGDVAPITVVLPTRDRPTMAQDAVQSVLRCSPPPAELIIVDQSDAPDQPATEFGGNGSTRIRIERPTTKGLSNAVNAGVSSATHDIVLVLHDDVLVEPGWVAAFAEAARRFGPTALLTGRVVAGQQEASRAFAPALATGTQSAETRSVDAFDVLKPLNMCFHRSLSTQVGGFDPRLGPGTPFPSAEDADFALRCLHAGNSIAFVPEAGVTHRAWRAGSDYLPLRWAYGYGRGAFYVKHMTAGDRAMLSRFWRDVLTRGRRFPRRLRSDGWRAFGDPLYLTANIVGGLHWLGRTWRAREGVTSPAPIEFAEYRPTIAPVPDEAGGARPTWSVMVPTYNCAPYLERTLRSVLDAIGDRTDVQIEVVDDCSTRDDPEAVVRSLHDPRLAFFRQPHNVGHVANFNTCLERSRGRYVHLLHGDDMVRPGFYDAMELAYRDHPEIGAAFSRYQCVDEGDHILSTCKPVRDEPGVLDGWLEEIATGNRLQVVCMTVRRDVYETVGGFDSRIPSYGEDWEMWVRIAARYPVYFDPEPRAVYRLRGSSLTHTATPTRNVEQLRLVADLNRAVLPGDAGAALARRANINAAAASLRRAVRAFDAGDRQTAVAHTRAALRRPIYLPIWGRLAEAAARITFRSGRRALQAVGGP
jgi:glycosyltransferase involved in cell wall biosynthesis